MISDEHNSLFGAIMMIKFDVRQTSGAMSTYSVHDCNKDLEGMDKHDTLLITVYSLSPGGHFGPTCLFAMFTLKRHALKLCMLC